MSDVVFESLSYGDWVAVLQLPFVLCGAMVGVLVLAGTAWRALAGALGLGAEG